jgi:hypothetical protein
MNLFRRSRFFKVLAFRSEFDQFRKVLCINTFNICIEDLEEIKELAKGIINGHQMVQAELQDRENVIRLKKFNYTFAVAGVCAFHLYRPAGDHFRDFVAVFRRAFLFVDPAQRIHTPCPLIPRWLGHHFLSCVKSYHAAT